MEGIEVLRIHRTWVQLLVDDGHKEEAAIAIETDIELVDRGQTILVDEDGGEQYLNHPPHCNHSQLCTVHAPSISSSSSYQLLVGTGSCFSVATLACAY